jgi:hypothetical protein
MKWIAAAPLGIAIVLDGAEPMFDSYDEGLLTELLLTGATLLGYGGGVSWFGDATQEAKAKQVLGIPDDRVARQIVMIGRANRTEGRPPFGLQPGRKPISELVSYEHWGATNKNEEGRLSGASSSHSR